MIFPKGDFTVGQNEQHKISFEVDWIWGGFTIKVDDQPTLVKGKTGMSGPFSIEVGEKEKHTVTIQILIPALFGFVRNKEVQVLVDGKLFKTFK